MRCPSKKVWRVSILPSILILPSTVQPDDFIQTLKNCRALTPVRAQVKEDDKKLFGKRLSSRLLKSIYVKIISKIYLKISSNKPFILGVKSYEG